VRRVGPVRDLDGEAELGVLEAKGPLQLNLAGPAVDADDRRAICCGKG
jgi:hypothetical protein